MFYHDEELIQIDRTTLPNTESCLTKIPSSIILIRGVGSSNAWIYPKTTTVIISLLYLDFHLRYIYSSSFDLSYYICVIGTSSPFHSSREKSSCTKNKRCYESSPPAQHSCVFILVHRPFKIEHKPKSPRGKKRTFHSEAITSPQEKRS